MNTQSHLESLRLRLHRLAERVRARKILVFISSPADCAAERKSAVEAVRRVSARPEIQKSGLRFEALLWEDLPPGEAPEGDFQARINSLLKRYGLHNFGIYIGFMRTRVGTPTKRYQSGTAEEFVESLKRRKFGGMPEEVLFYFVEPYASASSEVDQYRTSLVSLTYLYQNVHADKFEDALESHLLKIASEWFSWRKRAKRLPKQMAAPTLAAAGLVAVSLFTADAFLANQIDSELDAWNASGVTKARGVGGDVTLPLEAARLYDRRSAWMLRSADRSRRQLNREASSAIQRIAKVEDQVPAFATWRTLPAYDAGLTDDLAGKLRRRVIERVQGLTIAIAPESPPLPDNADIHLLKRAFESGLFAGDIRRDQGVLEVSETLRQILVRIAGRRMFAARVKATPDPGEWRQEETIETWKNEVVKEVDTLGYERVPSGRILALLAEGIMPAAGPSPDQIKRLVLQESDATPAQVEHFFKTWPTDKLLRIIWDFPDQLPAPIPPASKISAALTGLAQRGDDRPLADLLARIAAWDWPSQKFGEISLSDCSGDGCAIEAADLLNRALSRATLRVSTKQAAERVTDALVRSVPDGRKLSDELRSSLSKYLLAVFTDRVSQPQCEIDDIADVLSKLSTVAADAALAERLALQAGGVASCDLSEPLALLRHLSRRPDITDRDKIALQLLLAGEDKARRADILQVGRPGSPQNRYFSIAVAWLNVLASRGPEDKSRWSRDEIEAIKKLLAQDSSAATSTRNVINARLQRVLQVMPDPFVISLLSLSEGTGVEVASDPIWGRRIRLVQLLGKARAERPEIAEAIVRHLPAGRIADTLEWELPNISKEVSITHFRPKAFSGDMRSIAILFRLGDRDGLNEFVDLIAGLPKDDAHRRAGNLIAMIGERAADGAPDSSDILDRLVKVRGDVVDRDFDRLEYLFKSAAAALDNLTERQWFTRLALLARDAIQGDGSGDLFEAALLYCGNAIKEGGDLAEICGSAKFRDVTALLRDADTEQYAGLSTALGSYQRGYLPDNLAEYALNRPLLVVRELNPKQKTASGEKSDDRSLVIMQKRVSTPLLASAFDGSNQDQKRRLEQFLQGEGIPPEVEGTLADSALAFRTYLIRQLAPCDPLRSDPLAQLNSSVAEVALASAAYLARCADRPDIVQRLPEN